MIEPLKLHAYVDGELSEHERAEVLSLLRQSDETKREVEAIQALKTLVADKTPKVSVDSSWQACVRRLDELDKARKVERIVSKYAPAFCSLFFVAIVTGGMISRNHGSTNTSGRNLTAMLGRMRFDKSPVNEERQNWLKSLIETSKMSTPDRLQIRQADACEIDGMKVQRVVLRDDIGDVTLLLIPRLIEFEGFGSLASDPNLKFGRCWGRNCITRRQGDGTLVITADRSYEDLARLLGQIKFQ